MAVVLLIVNDLSLRLSLAASLRGDGHEVTAAAGAERGARR